MSFNDTGQLNCYSQGDIVTVILDKTSITSEEIGVTLGYFKKNDVAIVLKTPNSNATSVLVAVNGIIGYVSEYWLYKLL